MGEQMSEAFDKLMRLALALGVKDLASKVPPVWMHKIDEHWEVAMNGDLVDMHIDPLPHGRRMGATIPPCHAAVWYNGRLAALLQPYDGTFIVNIASEDAFIEVLDRALAATPEDKDNDNKV